MHGRGLRSDIRRDTYRAIVEDEPGGMLPAITSARGPKALTAHEYVEKQRRRPCRIFRGDGDVCERETCGHSRERHSFVWKAAVAA